LPLNFASFGHIERRFILGDTWITDLRHFLGDDGYVVSIPGKRLAQRLCQIVAMVTQQANDTPRHATLACRRRPRHQPCPGQIQAGFDGATSRIRWLCPRCGDNGWISGWQETHWDYGGRPALPTIRRVTYRWGLIRNLRERVGLPVTVLEGSAIPHEVVVAIHDNELLGTTGKFGDPAVGEPMQYDELTLEHAGGTDTMIVFNRAIMLFKTNEEFFVRFHRVACLIDDIGRPNTYKASSCQEEKNPLNGKGDL
jgi:hypothetical protein